jgi:hypothetical protein
MDNYLLRRSEELMLDRMPKNESIMDEIFNFNVRNLEAAPSIKLSQYIIGLSQFLIYFGSQVNKTKVELMEKRGVLDLFIDKSTVKGRTKSDKRRKVIDSSPDLEQMEYDINLLEQEVVLVENREKYLMELCNSFKRELTRRENELRFIREERKL